MLKVSHGIYRGPRPTPQELIDNNIGAVLDLESGLWELVTEDGYETMDFYELGIFVCKVGMSDFLPPQKKELLRARKFIAWALEHGLRVYIHCKSGKDRTGRVVVDWRVNVEGWSPERAYREWVFLGRHWWYFWWPFFD